MIDFNLKVFMAAAKMNSFTRAAEFLNLSQPAVTHQIKNLENILKTKLFIRCQNKIYLTKSGQILLNYAEDINLLYQKAIKEIHEANDKVAGDVYIGAASLLGKYLLPRIIGDFKKNYPDVNISMLVGNSKEILEYLQNDVIELAIVSEPITSLNFTAFQLYRDYLTVIIHPDHPWCKKRGITFNDLFAEDFISREVGSGTREVYLQTIVSRLATKSEVELGLLKEIRLKNVNMSRDFFVVFKSEKNLSVPSAKLKDYLKNKKKELGQFSLNKI